jgi:phospholipid/cholesterol/gamma-HCH transport system substrate-binding protein
MSEDLPPLPPSRTRDQALWVGVFLLIGLVATVGLLFTLTDAAMFRGRYIVTTNVPDAGGIRRGDPVQMRGVNIGRVMGFSIDQKGVTIRLEIQGEYPVPDDSKVELRSAGMLGGMVANVVPGSSTHMLRYGDKVTGVAEEALQSAAERMIGRADVAMDRVDKLLSEKFVDDLQQSGSELKGLLGELSSTVKEQRNELKSLQASLRRNSESLEKVTAGPELERTVKQLDATAARADQLVQSLDRSSKSLETVMGRMERGEGTLGKLSKDEQLYVNLSEAAHSFRESSEQISSLVVDLKKNPKKYLKLSMF